MQHYFIVFLISLLYVSAATAQVFKIRVIDYDGIDSVPALKSILDNRLQTLEDKVNDRLPGGSQGRIMQGMANTNVMVGKNISSDYSSGMEVWLLGASVSGAVDLEKNRSSEISGAGVAPGLTVGANLGRFGVERFAGLEGKRLNTYFNFLRFSFDQKLYERDGVEADGKVNSSTLGFRMRYDWLDGKGSKYFGWGGVKLHWGYQFTRTEYTVKGTFDRVVAVSNTDGQINGTVTGQPKFEIDVETHSIPLEISSEVHLLYFLTAFGGLGADLSIGKAKGKGVSNADVSPLLCTGGGFCGGGRLLQIQLQADLDAERKVYQTLYRGFLGLQLNLPYINIYGMVDKGIGTDLVGATAGIRFVY